MDYIEEIFFKDVQDLHPLAMGKGYKPPPPPPPPPPPEMDQAAIAKAEAAKAAAKADALKKKGRARTFLGGLKELDEAETKSADVTGQAQI